MTIKLGSLKTPSDDLHVVSGASQKHKPANFMRLETTQELITEIERSLDMRNGIDRCSDLSDTFKSNRGGADKGTWVCKELVYAYAMWISPKFHLQVILAFDDAQQEQQLELVQQSLPAPIQDDEKLQLINSIAQSMGIEESIAIVPAIDIMSMIQTIRTFLKNKQTAVAHLQTNPAWVDQTIERVKNATGKHFGEG